MRVPPKLLITALLCAALAAAVSYDWTDAMTPAPASLAKKAAGPAAMAPDVELSLLDGGTLRLHDLKGRRVMLNFWATWCLPCRKEFPALLQQVAESGGKTVLVAVSVDQSAEDIRRFLDPLRAKFGKLFEGHEVYIARDADKKISGDTFQTYQYPETILIGPDMRMRGKIAGAYVPPAPEGGKQASE
ncbi:MAG: redoxin domain-containing protein [Alphaproteobacteria bacterium]|nr:redoxin domain-containing protein [Alphaproteobacteria bacterium]